MYLACDCDCTNSGQQAGGAGKNLLTLPDSVMMYVVIQDLPGLCTNIVQLVGLKLNMRNIKDNQYGLWWWCVLCTVSGLAADWCCCGAALTK